MRTCPACGASAPPAATWCGQCYAVFAPAGAASFAPAPAFGGGHPAPAVPSAYTAPAVPMPDIEVSDVAVPMPHRALVLTLVAIGVGAAAMGASYLLGQDTSIAPAAYLRYAMVLTLAVYAVVGLLVVTQITPGVRLRWSDGKPALGAAVGLLVGGGLSVLLLAVVSAAAGHLDPDPRIVVLMSEGDVPHVVATVVLSCLAAPLVEEVLFRGLLLESQRVRGTAAAIWLSAIAFAVWHLSPSALRYYALMGALLGWLYTRRGLACSIAAHVGFNGVLTAAALSLVLTPGPTATVEGLSAQLPSGWRAISAAELPGGAALAGSAAGFRGPSGSAILLLSFPTPVAPDVDEVYNRIDASGFAAIDPAHTALHELRLPVGPAVEVVEHVGGDDATVVFVPHAGRSFELVLHGAGSVKARSDFARVLKDLRLSS